MPYNKIVLCVADKRHDACEEAAPISLLSSLASTAGHQEVASDQQSVTHWAPAVATTCKSATGSSTITIKIITIEGAVINGMLKTTV